MINLTIFILQLASPFILLGLLLAWIYRLSKDMKLLTRRWENATTDNEALWRRIREGEDGIYKKIIDIEEHIEEMDDVIVKILDDNEEAEDFFDMMISQGLSEVPRGNKTKSKTK